MSIGHLLIKHDERYYFIPSEKIGEPINCDAGKQKDIDDLVEIVVKQGGGDVIKFGLVIDPCDHLWRILRRN